MRRFRLRVVTAIVLAVLLLGSLASVANADEIPTDGVVLASWDVQRGPSTFPEDPWRSPWLRLRTSFPEDPWPGFTSSFPEDPWPAFTNSFPEDPWPDAN